MTNTITVATAILRAGDAASDRWQGNSVWSYMACRLP